MASHRKRRPSPRSGVSHAALWRIALALPGVVRADQLRELLQRSWQLKAPKRLQVSLSEAKDLVVPTIRSFGATTSKGRRPG